MGQTVCTQVYASPCGELLLGSRGEALCLCDWNGRPAAGRNRRRIERLLEADFRNEPTDTIRRAMGELDEYFAGRRRDFGVPLLFAGSDFQRQVWNALLNVPYGQICTYKDVAVRLDRPKAVRAVAQAIGANAIAIFCPCHRVVGSGGGLTGFAGGLEAKRQLLRLEALRR